MTGSSLTPYDYDDAPPPAGPEVSERSRAVALILQILGGPLGLHRFYVGRWQTGILMAITLGGMGLWWVYDLVILLAGPFPRSRDRRPPDRGLAQLLLTRRRDGCAAGRPRPRSAVRPA